MRGIILLQSLRLNESKKIVEREKEKTDVVGYIYVYEAPMSYSAFWYYGGLAGRVLI